jgi:hypothetical protein
MTPQAWQALWRFNLLAAEQNELHGIFRAVFREPASTAFLRTASQYLEQARPLLGRDGSVLAVERLLDEAKRYLRYVEFQITAENKKRADPATYQALRSRLLAVFQTPVPDIGGWGILGEFDEWEKARDLLEDGEFAEASRWCEIAECKLPEAIRERQENWRAAYGHAGH